MEIGSEMELNPSEYNKVISDNIFSYLDGFNTVYLDSGRSGIRLLHKMIPFGCVFLPKYICKSVVESFANRPVYYYKIDRNFKVLISDLCKAIQKMKPSILYTMNYWGNMMDKKTVDHIKLICRKTGTLIVEDTTHSIFSTPLSIGDYGVSSIRKWAPVPRGG